MTTTTSACCASSMAEFWRCFVGWQTVSRPDPSCRLVALRAHNDNDHLRLLRQLDGRVLALLRRLANRVKEAHLGIGKAPAQQFHQPPHLLDRLRGLRRYAESGPDRKSTRL